jgi:hypothetical protein
MATFPFSTVSWTSIPPQASCEESSPLDFEPSRYSTLVQADIKVGMLFRAFMNYYLSGEILPKSPLLGDKRSLFPEYPFLYIY